jgi:hypothetical protein
MNVFVALLCRRETMLSKYHSAEVDSVEMPAEGDYGIEYYQLPVFIRARSPINAMWAG